MREKDFSEGLLKTSYGMGKRFEGILKPLGVQFVVKDEKIESSVTAIACLYNVSKRVARTYYKLISEVNKSELVNIKRKVGME